MYMRDEMLPWMILIFCYILLAGSVPCDEEANIAFSGGYFSVDWERNENSTSFRKITFDFKPTYEFGVLFFIEFHLNGASPGNGSSLISMLSYNGSIIFSIQPKGQPTLHKDSVIINSLSSTKLSLHIRNNILRIKVKKKWHTFPFEGNVDVKSLLFGGARDFTTYDRFPVRKYFVGTLKNFNMGHNCISVVERNELTGAQAVVHDKCIQAVSSFVEFDALSRPLGSVTIQPTTHLRVNFTIAAKHCEGKILHLNGSFMVELSAGKLVTTITNSSGHSMVCTSNDVIDQSRWINVVITYINDTVKYFINDTESGSCHIDLGTVNFTGTLIVGGNVSFIGYLRHLYWDNSEINLVGLAATEQESCVGIGPVSCHSGGFNTTYPPSCPTCTVRDLPIHWATFDVSVKSNLTVNEEGKTTIRSDNFMLSCAGSQCQSLQRLRRNINFTIQKPDPAFGKLDHMSFTLENLYKEEVHYVHSGAEEKSDVINLLVQVRCGTKILYKESVKMYIHVNPINDYPELRLSPISMVIGTRKVITRSVIVMSDTDTPLQRVRCIENKVGQDGVITGQFEWANKPGYRITESFNQDDIDGGRIVLRLFLNATGTSKVALTVTDDSIIKNFGNFDVHGSQDGIIMLMNNKSAEVVENRSVSIDESHLVVGTNFVTSFGYQSPVVSFILTSFPKYGELLLAHNESFIERNISHFTQNHIRNEVLFYSHNVHVQNPTSDCFTFKLMIDDFEGDSDKFCVDILIEDHLPKLVLNMTISQNITLLEGGEKLITNEDLNITSGLKLRSGQINTTLPDDVIILILFIEPPKYGSLYLNNSIDNKRVGGGGSNISLDQLMAGLLVYDHEEEEEHQDRFRVKIIAQNFSHLPIHSRPVSSMEYPVFVDITPINNKYPIIQIYKNLSITEGLLVYLTTDAINITDADRPVENLTVYIIPKVGFNGHFATRDNYSVAISKFSVNQMIDRQIVFNHRLGKELEEDYTLVVSDGLHNSSSEIKVVAKPVILNVSTAHSIDECSLHLDLLTHNSVQIHDRLFSISLNSGNAPNVQVTATMDSGIYFNNNIDIYPITNFSKRDIDQGYIWYVVKDKKTRVSEQQFGLSFSIGHAEPVHVQFRVCLSLLPYPQLNTVSNLNLLLPEGGDIEINSSLLSSTDTRNHTSLYNVWYELLVPPAYGQLMMRLDRMQVDTPAMKFYQQDVDAGDIYYDNHNHSSSGDKLILTLSNQFYNHTANITINITIFLLELKVVNNGFTAREGGNHTILSNELYATGPHGYSVMFYIDSPPVHGSVTLNTDHSKIVSNFSRDQLDDGLVAYINGGEEFYQDSMKITIKATTGSVDTPPHIMNTTYSGTVHIRIELVNDNEPRRWRVTNEFNISDGDSLIFTPYNLSYQDDDANMDINLLEYTVLTGLYVLEYGYIFFGPNKTVVTHFLQRDIFDLQIGYQSNKSFKANNDKYRDVCVLSISDGKHSVNDVLGFNIVPFTVKPKNNENLLLDEGGEITLLDKNLLFVATKAKPPANDSEYIYKIIRQPMHGQLVMSNSCNCTFTQEELRNGSVTYKHDDSDTTRDSFTFEVTVRGFKTDVMMFGINIDPVDDEVPSVTYIDRLIVHFNQAVYFNRSVIKAVDSEAGLSDLVFNVVKAPKFGSMKRQRTGPRDNILGTSSFTQLQVNGEAIFYQHEKEVDGEWIDSVTLSLSDGRNPYDKLIVITFILLPYVLPIRVNGITLLEGRIVPLTAQDFEVTHPYLSTLELFINITEPVTYGDLLTLYQPSTVYFNSTELENGTILYFNREDYEVAEDKFKFVAMAGGISSAEHTFVFTIESENDETPVIVNNLMISLWAGEVKLIGKDKLFANDSDAHPPDKLEYIIGTNTSLGYFALKGADRTPITKFSQDDIVTGAVVFRSTTINDTEVEINFTVTDGKHQVDSYITLEITVLIVTVSAQHIEVAMGAEQLISFSPHTNDVRVKREFCYHVLTPPVFGTIMDTVSGLKVTNFTQEQISNQQIVYKHTALDRYETNDTVDFVVSTDLAERVQVSLNVSIILKSGPTGYLAASGSLDVDEGGTVCLNNSILDASNVLYKVWKNSNQSIALHELNIQYVIVSHPSAGTLKSGNVSIGEYFEHSDMKSSTGVCYHHNGSETTSDYFSVTINISYNSTDVWYTNSTEIPIPVHIRPLNDEEPCVTFVDNICVYKAYNYTAIIHPEDMHIHDEDTSDEELVIVISSQSEVVCSVTDIPTRNFTQSDINTGKVKCMSPPSVNSSSNLTFYVTDGNNFSENKRNYTVYYHNVILMLSVTHNMSKLNYSQDRGLNGVILTNKQLNSSATCNRGATIYTMISLPMHGNVTKLNSRGAVNNFTQLDIDDEMIQYVATNRSSYNDTFTMNVTNKHAAPQQVTVHVTAMAMMNVTRPNVTLSLPSVNHSRSRPLPIELFPLVNVTDTAFTVISELSYGYLDLQSEKRSSQRFSFRGSQLVEGRVLYVLNKNVTNGTEVLQLSVQPDDMQAGFAEVSFSFSVQPSPTSTPIASPTAQPVESNRPSYDKGSGFTLVALVPIMGVPSFILMVVIILVCFWYSQKLKEKKRCAAARGSSAICMGTPPFNLPTAHNTMATTDIDHNSENSSYQSSNNSDEGISMALPPEDQAEDEGVAQREDRFQSRPVMDYTQYHHPLTSAVYTTSGYGTPIPQHAHKLPILKNEEYWL